MNQQPRDPLLLFYSYAHEDEALRNVLDKHLLPLQHNGLITIRDDRHIMPGTDRSHAIGQYLKESAVILLLVSPDYLASASCYQTEMPQALERHRRGDALVIPVLLRPVDMDVAPFAHLQSLPRNGKPVTLWEHQDAVWHEIARELRHLLEDLRAKVFVFSPPSQLIEQHQSFQIQGGVQTKGREETAYRMKYLKHLTERYSTVTLPTGPIEGLALQAIFQPLTLRHDPLTVEDLQREQWRTLFARENVPRGRPDVLFEQHEALPKEEQPVIVAHTSQEALEKSPQKRMVILGGPGTGKTTVLQFLIHEHAQKALADLNAPLPIMISLPDLARSGSPLQKYLSCLTEEAWVPDHFALTLGKAIEEGKAFICLDSLDEVAPELRPDMIRMINERAAHCGNIWIVGSRFTDYKGGQFRRGQFAEWELQPMTHTLRLELARRLFPELSRLSLHHRAQGSCSHLTFVGHLEAHSQAAAWGENPLLFSLAAVVFVRLGHLPSSRVALYEQVIKAILQIREKNPRRQTMLYHVLSCLALELYTRKGRTFNSQDLLVHLPAIRQSLQENWTTEDMAQRLLNSGILSVLPHEVCSFRHQTFQEYLATVALAQQLVSPQTSDTAWEFIWQRRTYSHWTEVLRLMVGVLIREHHREGAHKARAWLSALIEQQQTPKGDPGNQGLSLALKSLAEIPETATPHWKAVGGDEVEDTAVTTWVEKVFDAARHGYKKQQHYLEALGTEIVHLRQRVTRVAMQRIHEVLRDGAVEARTAAVEELTLLGVCAPIEPLVAALRDEATSVRAAAAKVLGGLEANIPIESLLVAIHDPCEEVRAAAIEALGGLGKSAPLEPLQIALNDPAWNVRRAAVKALGEPGLLVPLEVFIAMTQDEDPSVRAAVLETLGKMGANAPLEPLLASLKDRKREVRAAAARALAHFGEQMPITPLLETLKNYGPAGRRSMEEYDDITGTLIKQIERVPLEPLVAIMEEARKGIQDEYWLRQWSVLDIVSEMGRRAPLNLVLTALSDNKTGYFVPRAAVRAIGKLKMMAVGERVLSILNNGDEEPAVRVAAVEAIVHLKEEDAGVKILLDALNDPVEQVRVAAAKMLGKIKKPFSAEQLLTEACKRCTWVRPSMISVLGKLEEQAPLPLLLSLLNDENETDAVRAAAGRALVDLGEHVPIATLQSIIQHKDSKIRQGIAWKLSHPNLLAFVEDLPVVSLLVALRHENWHTRLRAAQKLAYDKEGSLGDVPPKQELITFKNWLHLQKETERIIPAELLEILVEILLKDDDNGMDIGIHNVAARVLEELKEFIPTKLVQHLFAASHDKKSQMRPGVFKALIGLGSLLPSDWLIEALAHEDWQWRKTAAYTMGMRKEALFVPSLLVALGDPHPKVRIAVAQALEKIHQQPSVEPLLAVLHDTEMSVRLAVASTLSTFAISFSPAPVLEALAHPNVGVYLTAQSLPPTLNDEQREACYLVAKVLNELGTCVPGEMLISAAQSEDWGICTAAIRSLIGRSESISWELLFRLIAKKSSRQRRYNNFPYDMEEIPEMIQEDALRQGGEVGNWVAYVLGRQGRKKTEKLLLRMMDQGDEEIRWGGEAGLGQSGANVPIELLEKVFQYGNPRMRIAAAGALSSMLQEDVPPTTLLFLALQDRDADVRFQILRPMANSEIQIPLDPLLTCLCIESDDWHLSYIVRALGARSLEEQIPLEPILNLFDRDNVRLRASVIRILGRFGARAPVDLLIATLGDSEQLVREAAAEALKQAHPEALRAIASEAVSLLQEQKSGSPFDSVAHAFFADIVTHMGHASPAVFERLTELLDWPYWQVRVKAIHAFGQLRRSIPDKAIRRLLELRDDPQSRAVRQAADEVLAEILSLETGIEDD